MDDAGGAGTGAGSGAGTGAAAEAVAATAGADGLVRVWDLAAAAPSLTAVMRGHEGRVLCLCWVLLGARGGGGGGAGAYTRPLCS